MLCKILALFALFALASQIQAQTVTLPLCGNFDEIFMYYVHINVGTPGNDFTVTVDTGRCVESFRSTSSPLKKWNVANLKC